MSLVARHLEAAGIPTVVVGSARDIVEQCGVARFLFVDFPLGNPCGKPGDRAMQRAILELGLELAQRAFAPRTTVQAPVQWSHDESWRDRFMEVTDENRAELLRAGQERKQRQASAKRSKSGSTTG